MKVLWLQSGGCGGCTQSLLCAEPRPLFDELHDAGIEFLWHPGLSLESGEEALAILEDCAEGRLAFDALCVEGDPYRGDLTVALQGRTGIRPVHLLQAPAGLFHPVSPSE